MGSEYTYILVADKYFCCKCNIVLLVWTLLVNNKGRQLGIYRRQIPIILISIIKYRYLSQSGTTDTLILPTFGHVCMRVHRGYKVFNLSRLTTTKIFDHSLSESTVLSEINCARDAGSLSFAPQLLEVDPQNRWYTETFITGEKSSKNEPSDPKLLYDHVVADHLTHIILSKPVQTVGLAQHLNKVRGSITQLLEILQLDNDLSTSIHDFVNNISANLETTEDITILLAFTHGDFSFVNFMYKNSGVVVVDWEGAQYRSILHDLYNYFFTELYYGRTRSDLVVEIDDAILLLSRHIESSTPPFSGDLVTLKNVYRGLFYLERMEMLLDREPSTGILNVIRHSVEIFNQHESRIKYHNT